MTPEVNDELQMLLSRSALGDRTAFAALYRVTSPKLFWLALRIVRRRDWAEDVIQEGFISIWSHAESYRIDRGSPFSWMASIVRNRALDYLRRSPPDAGELDEELAADEKWSDPLARLTQSSEGAALARCLERLSAEQRQTVALAYYHGLTQQELADHLGSPLGTVKTWIRRGLARLKECLE